MSITIRAYEADRDADWLLALNNAHAVEIAEETATSLGDVLAHAAHIRIAEVDGAPAAMLVGIASGRNYESLNYRWFTQRGEEPFVYVDRVAVDDAAKGKGVGRALYEDLERRARDGDIPRIVCEVNERPPNPASLAFHARMGFVVLEAFENEASGKRVAMLEKRL